MLIEAFHLEKTRSKAGLFFYRLKLSPMTGYVSRVTIRGNRSTKYGNCHMDSKPK